jgi:hypothetical protein
MVADVVAKAVEFDPTLDQAQVTVAIKTLAFDLRPAVPEEVAA